MKTESNIRPSVRFEVEAFPKADGVECPVVLYDNVKGPYERSMDSEGTSEKSEYYEYDRFEIKTKYRKGLEETIEASVELWIDMARSEEEKAEEPTEMEKLKNEVSSLKKENKELNEVVDELIIASLGGVDLV